MQAVLLLSIVILIYFVLRLVINVIVEARAKLQDERSDKGEEPPSQAMVRCAHCGIHLPQSEAYYDGQHTYCSEGHMKLGPKDYENNVKQPSHSGNNEDSD